MYLLSQLALIYKGKKISETTARLSMIKKTCYQWYNRTHGGMITGGLIRKRVLSMTSSRGTAHKKLKKIDWFGHANWVNSSNFEDTTLRFAEKFDHPFSHVFIFFNMFRESHGFISVPVTSSHNFVSYSN